MLTTKRSDAEIIREIRKIDLNLEPEHLYRDGERDPHEARREEATLRAKRRELVKELGREPRSTELW